MYPVLILTFAESGKLLYNWANISAFAFSTAFIRKASNCLQEKGQYHIARKKIPSILGPIEVSSPLMTETIHKTHCFTTLPMMHMHCLNAIPTFGCPTPYIQSLHATLTAQIRRT